MPKLSKRRRANAAIAPTSTMSPEEAVPALRRFKAAKFDETVNVVVNLGIDPKQADQSLRGSIAMPHGIGKSVRVVCFCNSDKIEAAKAAGAIEAGSDDLVEKIEGGWMDFDVAVASPDMMRVVSKLGKVLGPKGLMPSPKAGTVAPDVVSAVREYSAGKQEYRNDAGGNVHCVLGKLSFPDDHLIANLRHFLSTIERVKPSSAKGHYLRKCVIHSTMGPAVPVSA